VKRLIIGAFCLILTLALYIGCSGEKAVEIGDRVRVAYRGTTEDGVHFDSTNTGDYIEFVVGQGQVIPGFDRSVVGMVPGENKLVVLSSDEAYGPYRPEYTHQVPASEFPDTIAPVIGLELDMGQPDGKTVRIQVTDIQDDTLVTLDANHPLAGKSLNFDLTLVEIMPSEE